VSSAPFEVVAGSIDVELRREGDALTVRATRRLPQGYRLLDLEAPSNGLVPLRGARVSLTVTLANGGVRTVERALDGDGRVRLASSDVPAAQVRRVTVQSAAADRGEAALP
jgi:hypothetical protein